MKFSDPPRAPAKYVLFLALFRFNALSFQNTGITRQMGKFELNCFFFSSVYKCRP